MEFQNKTVIITGAAAGTGKTTAIEFAKQGANVCIIDFDEAKLDITKSEILKLGVKCSAYICDISDEKRVREVVSLIQAEYGQIHVLINNAALWRVFKPFVDSTSDEWLKMASINIFGAMYFSHAVLPNMLKNNYGRIINIGSVAGVYGNVNMVTYSMTKGALSSFTKALAKEVAACGITVNNVVPGTIGTEDVPSETELCYMGRTGYLEEYAHLITFLASDKAAYISGQDYQIDGCRKRI